MVEGATPSTWKIWSTSPHWSEIADFQPIFACSASAVNLSRKTSSKKSSINTNRSPLCAFQWA